METLINKKQNIVTINRHFILINDDSLIALKNIKSESVDMIFADPPYFLSNGGITCRSGKIEKVDKGSWDKEVNRRKIDEFNQLWIKECKRILKRNGTIWITGTFHNIYSVGQAIHHLGFKILNNVVWQKVDPPPNMSHRMFTHSSELIIWAKKSSKSRHTFHYHLMLEENNGKQMTDVWKIPAVQSNEKSFGYHPTQKPIQLLNRIIRSSTNKNDVILDPFCGSGTTGVTAVQLQRKFIGIDITKNFINLANKRIFFSLQKNSKNI